jgi:hypothetical protein
MRKPVEETLLWELRETRLQMETLATLLAPESSEEDPVAILTGTLKDLVRLIGEQNVQLSELRTDIAELSAVLQGSD